MIRVFVRIQNRIEWQQIGSFVFSRNKCPRINAKPLAGMFNNQTTLWVFGNSHALPPSFDIAIISRRRKPAPHYQLFVVYSAKCVLRFKELKVPTITLPLKV